MSKRPTLDANVLTQFTGSENGYCHSRVPEGFYTDGVLYVAENADAYWLLDEIALAQRYVISVKSEDFQVWDLTVNADHSALLTCEDGDGHEVFVKRIEFTDFPEQGIRFYYANWVIHLPSEY